MNSKCHRRASASAFRPLLIIESAPLGPRISNLVCDHETARHANNLGRIIVADELRTLTLRTQSSRPRTRRNSRYLFQRLSQVFFLMLLILLDLEENPADECAINIRDRLHRDIWSLHRTQNIIDHSNTADFIVADWCADHWYWILFESKEKIATL